MKKIVIMLLAAMLCTGAFVGCGSGNTNSKNESSAASEMQSEAASDDVVSDESVPEGGVGEIAQNTKESAVAKAAVEAVKADVSVSARLMPINDQLLNDIFNISVDDVEEYYGEYSMINVNCDTIIGIRVAADKKQEVLDGLNEYVKSKEKEFEQYLQDQYQKAQKAKIIEKDDYVFLVIVGESMESIDADVAKAEEIIRSKV